MTRRRAIKTLAAAAVLGLGRWPGPLRAASPSESREEFTFTVVNDTHYKTPECSIWLERVVWAMKTEGPEFCLHVGDIVDDGKREHLAETRRIFEGLGVPFYPVIGNHDYSSQTDRTAYEEVFPERLNYEFEHRGWRFVALDSTEGKNWEATTIGDATLEWVDPRRAHWRREQPLVLFTHFPMADGVQFRPKNAKGLLERFQDHNLQAVFNGHFHGYTAHPFHQAVVTTDRCCALRVGNFDGTKEKGFFVCTAGPAGVTRRFVEVSADGIVL